MAAISGTVVAYRRYRDVFGCKRELAADSLTRFASSRGELVAPLAGCFGQFHSLFLDRYTSPVGALPAPAHHRRGAMTGWIFVESRATRRST